MTQTEYLVSCGAPPLPKGWHYEVRYLPEYDKDRDKWYTIIDAKVQNGDTVLSSVQYTLSSAYFEKIGTKCTLDTVKSAYRRIGRPQELVPQHLTSLPYKEPND